MALPESFEGKLRLPAVAAPMFLVSNPALVIESCRSGVVGSFPALNCRTSEGFEQWVEEIKAALAGGDIATPWGVNLIVHRSNPRVEADLALCEKHEVPLVITSLGAVPDPRQNGCMLMAASFFTTLLTCDMHASAAAAGVDGLIAVCAGAGGHAGTLNPLAITQEIRSFFEGTLLLSGCISTGGHIAAALAMRADLAYLGTRFINTADERGAGRVQDHDRGCGGRRHCLHGRDFGGKRELSAPEPRGQRYRCRIVAKGGVRTSPHLKAIDSEVKAWKTIWSAGQGVGGIDDVPTVAETVVTVWRRSIGLPRTTWPPRWDRVSARAERLRMTVLVPAVVAPAGLDYLRQSAPEYPGAINNRKIAKIRRRADCGIFPPEQIAGKCAQYSLRR